MTNEIEVHQGSALALSGEQSYWNDQQLAALRHMGVENANGGDLAVFHHVCQRTGLDPFARQIHMIGRNTKNQRTNQWETKYTIQTGIDGFRLIGRRAADAKRQTISVDAPQWAHADGSWRDVWSPAWGLPIAARVTIRRNGEPFNAVALFNEYRQTKKDGELTSMWAQRPAGQLAKCAEALAWRMAFPQDLSGIYADEEMQQADRHEDAERSATTARSTPRGLAAALAEPVVTVEQAEQADSGEAMTDSTRGEMFALFGERGITDRDEQIRGIVQIVGHDIESRGELTETEARAVVATLRGTP